MKKTWAYIFVTTKEPRKVVQAIRRISGVIKADALFGTPDVIFPMETRFRLVHKDIQAQTWIPSIYLFRLEIVRPATV